MKTTRKILSILLVLLMCITAVPLSGYDLGTVASAADTVNCTVKYDVESGFIHFGSYPQSKVTDEATIIALNEKVPDWDKWTSYGYYCGTDGIGTMVQGDWMRYTDVTYKGEKYRGVKFTQCRPSLTTYESWHTKQEINGYYANRIYWFKFEPLKWRVLDESIGLIMCETLIDSQPYSNTAYEKSGAQYDYKYFSDTAYTHYACDYETSSIRAWLNDDFYSTAFTSAEQSKIESTTLNNKSFLTLLGYKDYEQFDSNNTNDKVFLLSYDEARNESYFSSDAARIAQSSDYAKCQGIDASTDSTYKGNSEWYLRTPSDYSDQSAFVGEDGHVGGRGLYVYNTSHGVRPALKLDLTSAHKWTHTQEKMSCIDNSGNIEHWYCETCKTYIVKNEKGEYVKTTKDALTAKATPAIKDGNYIYFGSYPQSKVTDEATITALNAKAPSWANWTNYGYYSDGTMTQGDWMRYTDVTYKGEKYRGVKFTQYRPKRTEYTSLAGNSRQYYNGYSSNVIYSLTSGVLVGDDKLDVVVTREIGEDADTYTIAVGQVNGANANYDITFETGTFTINKKTIGIVWGDTDFLDDGTDKLPTATATGTAFDDEIALVVEGAQKEIGTGYTATVTGIIGDKADNYELPEDVTTTFNITRSCTCMCHSSPIAKLIYMILDIILTFFGSSYDCRCGESHF